MNIGDLVKHKMWGLGIIVRKGLRRSDTDDQDPFFEVHYFNGKIRFAGQNQLEVLS